MASRRNYVTATEVNDLAGFTPTDVQISEAEEIIDAYVGHQRRFLEIEIRGRAQAGSGNTLTLQDDEVDKYEIDYFKWTEIEIIGGTGAGQRRIITASTKAGVVTVASNWNTQPDNTSIYRIYQLGKFPRYQDVYYYTDSTPYQYAKSIPEAVKRAVAAQCEYINEMGDEFFSSDKSEKVSESIGDYSYTNSEGDAGSSGLSKLIAPKARLLLRGYKNRLGEIV